MTIILTTGFFLHSSVTLALFASTYLFVNFTTPLSEEVVQDINNVDHIDEVANYQELIEKQKK